MENATITDSQDMMYILDEYGKMKEISRENVVEVKNPIKYKIKNAFEVFVLVDGTENYWISNYGRCVNNLKSNFRNTSKDKFYEHKQGDVHYSLYEIEKDGSRWQYQTRPDELVAKMFLVKCDSRNKVWHKDGDFSHNWYKNLIYVSGQNYKDLKSGKVTLDSLNLEQDYIEYKNKANKMAYLTWYAIYTRCGNSEAKDNIHECYDEATMCEEWLKDPKLFAEWYFEHYYEVEGELMAVDKDLFGNGSKMYAPEFCCLLPQTLNTMLANSKKHYFDKENKENVLPLGVSKCKDGKYQGIIKLFNLEERTPLSVWNTPEEAFAEYKMFKQADNLVRIAQYNGKIPDEIYRALIEVEVQPY